MYVLESTQYSTSGAVGARVLDEFRGIAWQVGIVQLDTRVMKELCEPPLQYPTSMNWEKQFSCWRLHNIMTEIGTFCVNRSLESCCMLFRFRLPERRETAMRLCDCAGEITSRGCVLYSEPILFLNEMSHTSRILVTRETQSIWVIIRAVSNDIRLVALCFPKRWLLTVSNGPLLHE